MSVILAWKKMRNLILFVTLFILQGCIVYPGTYYYPKSEDAQVISVGSCGDNTPSMIMLDIQGLKLSAQAENVLYNENQTWIWLDINADDEFYLLINQLDFAFVGDGKNIYPHRVSYSYRIKGSNSFYENYNSISALPDVNIKSDYFTFVFALDDYNELNISGSVVVNGILRGEFKIAFEKRKTIRMSALNC